MKTKPAKKKTTKATAKKTEQQKPLKNQLQDQLKVRSAEQNISRQIKEITAKITQISKENHWEYLLDHLAHDELVPLLRERGIKVRKAWIHCQDRKKERRWDIDILTYGKADMVAINLYPTLEVEDVDNFIDMIKQFRKGSSLCADRALYGGVAYFSTYRHVEVYAEEQGLFVIRVPG